MQSVLIYGDSNVWGENLSGPRIAYGLRWATRLKRKLKNDYTITADGVCGRIAGAYRLDKPTKNGKDYFQEALKKAGNVDIVIIALGTNDLQQKFSRSAEDVINDLLWYGSVVGTSKILYILPPNFDDSDSSGPEFTHVSKKLRSDILAMKEKLPDSIEVDAIELSDGIHFSDEGHRQMANIVAAKLKKGIMS